MKLIVHMLSVLTLILAPMGGEQILAQSTQPSIAQMKQLIEDLGSNSFRIRQNATKQLEEMGEIALDFIRPAAAGEREDPEICRRASLLARKIQARYGIVAISGMEFKPLIDRQWLAPELGQSTVINLSLIIRRTARKSCCMRSTARIVLRDKAGADIPFAVCVDSFQPSHTPLVLQNRVYAVRVHGRLALESDGLKLWTDVGDGSYVFHRVRKGDYVAALRCDSNFPFPGLKDLWMGSAQTGFLDVTIK